MISSNRNRQKNLSKSIFHKKRSPNKGFSILFLGGCHEETKRNENIQHSKKSSRKKKSRDSYCFWYCRNDYNYCTGSKSFKEYRGRVIERFGKELDRELKYNIKAKEVEETVVSDDGTEIVEKKTIELADPNTYSPYAKFYDDGCSGWTKDPEANLMFLRMQQDAATKRLKQQGWLLLNDVYDMLGIPRTKDGMVIGWVYDEKHPVGDNFVDFGIYDTNRASNRDFVNGYERTILLDFNVDGNIYDLM